MNTLRHALRSLRQSPGFSVVAVLMLALGIGLSAGSFSLANAFLLRNVPYPEPDRLVRFFATSPQFDRGSFSPGNILALREAATSYSGIAIYHGDAFALGEPGQPAEQVSGMNVTANFFELIGVQPFLGRGFVTGDDQPDSPRIAILSHRSWVRRYDADPSVIGRTVRLNAENYTIVGVLPERFEAPLVWGPADFIRPVVLHAGFATNFKDSWMNGVARLKPGISSAQASAELKLIAARLVSEHPKENATLGLRLVSLHDSNMDNISRVLLWLMTALSLAMLLIACANLASLQVARAFGRSREFAVRSALGADRTQLMKPLLAESLILAVTGGVGSLFVAAWSNRIIGSFLRINGDLGYEIPLDGRVFAFAAVASIVSGVAFGLAPAWLASRAPAAEALKEGSRGATASRSHQRLKNLLIVGELAVALALVGAATSFGIGARTFMHRQVGWDPQGLFAGYVSLPWNRYTDNDKCRVFHKALLEKLSLIPGVDQAVLCGDLPLFYLGGGTLRFTVEGQPPVVPGQEPLTQTVAVSPDYFSAIRLALKSGRPFPATMTEKDPPLVIVNDSFAKRFWPGESALGRRVRIGDDEKWSEIIGVVPDIKLLGRFEAADTPLQLYRHYLHAPDHYFAIALRGSVAPAALTKAVRDAVASIDPDLPVTRAGDVLTSMDENLSNINLVIVNLGISAVMGLLIAGVGLFGVMSQLTLQRTRDIGVRMALGASRGDILRLIIGGGLKLLAAGLLLGVPGFFALNRLLGNAMPSIEFPGVWLLVLDAVVLGAAMLLACYLPALRATRISPTEALRAD